MKTTLGSALLVLACLATFPGCREPFVPDVEGFADALVVEGRMTNDPLGSTVRLTRSYGFGEDQVSPVRNATVVIEQQGGPSHTLIQVSPGTYRTNPAVFPGIPGEAYRLVVNVPDGKSYLSSFETMLVSPPVDTVRWVSRSDPTLNPDRNIEGIEIQVDTRGPADGPRFFQWTYQETWEFYVPFPISKRWTWGPPPRAEPIGPDEQVRRCWRTVEGTGLRVGSSRQLEENAITRFPIAFVRFVESKTAWGYSMLVRQYALSEAEYLFLDVMRRNTETTGSLFDPLPAEVRGNIREEGNPDAPVIGFFGASTVSEKRMFVTGDDLPTLAKILRPFRACELDTLPLDWAEMRAFGVPTERFFYDTLYNLMYQPIGILLARPECSDCRITGTPVKPDFWP